MIASGFAFAVVPHSPKSGQQSPLSSQSALLEQRRLQ
jgi:hypothetical protein